MLPYVLPFRPEEILGLLESEIASSQQQPELYHTMWKDYLVEEDFDRARYGISDGADYSLVSVDAVLNIEPRLEQNYWVLRVVVHRVIGPQQIDDEAALIGATLTLDQFKAFLADPANTVSVQLDVSTPFARQHFHTWLSELRAHHQAECITDS